MQKVHHVTSIVSFAFEICTDYDQLYTIPTIIILYQLNSIEQYNDWLVTGLFTDPAQLRKV